MTNETLNYLIRFLLGDDVPEELVRSVGYTADPSLFHLYALVIVPSNFFDNYGQPASLPTLPLQTIKGVPFLFGANKSMWIKDTLVVCADFIASAYFLLTRYEEMLCRDVRDRHGRFPGKQSLPYRAGFIHRPIIDEYRLLIRSWLRTLYPITPRLKPHIRHIWLTHDIDAPFRYRSWKGIARSIRDGRGLRRSLQASLPPADPYYTFPWLFEQNKCLEGSKTPCRTLLFFKSGASRDACDKPRYRLQSADLQYLLNEARQHNCDIGLHAGYRASNNPHLLAKEKQRLEKHARQPIRYNRYHFLACREPEDLDLLEAAGFTDDFTMGYADVAGFRLGTSRPVRWLNPVTQRLSSLTLHPLTLMDVTLTNPNYMALTADQAADYCLQLLERIRKTGGEVNLLWHNNSVAPAAPSYPSYLRALYLTLLAYLRQKI